jgi:predicted PurR-regulated permease PerM
VGLLSVLAVPAGVALSWYSEQVTLIEAMGSAGLALVLGFYAVLLGRRARERVQQTIGRAGGDTTARIGKLLGSVGICIGLTAALAVGFYGLLALFAT